MAAARQAARIVLAGDSLLGRHEPGIPDTRSGWLRAGFAGAVEQALYQHADLFIQTGNLFASPNPSTADRAMVGEQLAALGRAGVAVCLIAGDRDDGDDPPQREYTHLEHVRYLAEGEVVRYTLGGLRLLVRSLGHTFRIPADPATLHEILPVEPGVDTQILLCHAVPEGSEAAAVEFADAQMMAMSVAHPQTVLVAGGGMQHLDRTHGNVRLLVPGTTERFRWESSESDVGCMVLDIDPQGIPTTSFVNLPSQPRCTIEVDTADLQDSEAQARLIERIGWGSSPETLLRLILRGSMPRASYVRLGLRRIQDEGNAKNFGFMLDTASLEIRDDDNDTALNRASVRFSQQAELAACVDDILKNIQDAGERALIEEARRALLARYTTE